MDAATVTQDDLTRAINRIAHLVTLLPNTIPLATALDVPAQAYKSIVSQSSFIHSPETEDPWEVFSRYFDVVFGENTRQTDGRLKYVLRGIHGMDLFVQFARTVIGTGRLPADIAKIKIERLLKELAQITNAPRSSCTLSTVSSGALPTTALTSNNDISVFYSLTENSTLEIKKSVKRKEVEANTEVDNEFGKSDNAHTPSKRRRDDSDDEFDGEHEELTKKRSMAVSYKSFTTASTSTSEKGRGSQADPVRMNDSGEESDTEKPQRQRRGPRNQSLKYFHDAEPTVATNGKKRWLFRCRMCGATRSFVRTIDGDNITFDDEPILPKLNNLATHSLLCQTNRSPEKSPAVSKQLLAQVNLKESAEMLKKYLEQGRLNPGIMANKTGFLDIFCAWILDEDLPWTTGEAPTLTNLFRYLGVNFQLPTETTVRNQLAHIFQDLQGKVVKAFSNVKSRIAYSTDTWTTQQMIYSFTCTIGSFIDDDWSLQEYVVDLKPLEDKEYEGFHAAQAFVEGAQARGGLNKITTLSDGSHYFISLTTSNASVNDVIFETTSRMLLTRYGIPSTADQHIRCIAHVVNVVVQAFLHALGEADDPNVADDYLDCRNAPIHYNIDEDLELKAMEDESFDDAASSGSHVDVDQQTLNDTVEELYSQSALKRLRYITTKIVSSPQQRQKFRRIARNQYEDSRSKLLVVRDHQIRWHSTHAMIKRALVLQEAVDTWVLEEMCALTISLSDWERLRSIGLILEPFTKVTLKMSQASQPTIPFVLPLYLMLEQHLTHVQTNVSNPAALCDAAGLALEELNKYKNLAFDNQYYKLGTLLHPFFRAQWFQKIAKDEKGQKDAVSKAEILLRHIAEKYHEEYNAQGLPTQVQSLSETATSRSSSFFAEVFDFEIDWQQEIDRYLRFEGGQGQLDGSPLRWWKKHGSSFPILAHMARDFLAIPATSVSFERTFSKSRQTCADLRSLLKADTIRQALLSKVWIKSGLFEMVKRPEE